MVDVVNSAARRKGTHNVTPRKTHVVGTLATVGERHDSGAPLPTPPANFPHRGRGGVVAGEPSRGEGGGGRGGAGGEGGCRGEEGGGGGGAGGKRRRQEGEGGGESLGGGGREEARAEALFLNGEVYRGPPRKQARVACSGLSMPPAVGGGSGFGGVGASAAAAVVSQEALSGGSCGVAQQQSQQHRQQQQSEVAAAAAAAVSAVAEVCPADEAGRRRRPRSTYLRVDAGCSPCGASDALEVRVIGVKCRASMTITSPLGATTATCRCFTRAGVGLAVGAETLQGLIRPLGLPCVTTIVATEVVAVLAQVLTVSQTEEGVSALVEVEKKAGMEEAGMGEEAGVGEGEGKAGMTAVAAGVWLQWAREYRRPHPSALLVEGFRRQRRWERRRGSRLELRRGRGRERRRGSPAASRLPLGLRGERPLPALSRVRARWDHCRRWVTRMGPPAMDWATMATTLVSVLVSVVVSVLVLVWVARVTAAAMVATATVATACHRGRDGERSTLAVRVAPSGGLPILPEAAVSAAAGVAVTALSAAAATAAVVAALDAVPALKILVSTSASLPTNSAITTGTVVSRVRWGGWRRCQWWRWSQRGWVLRLRQRQNRGRRKQAGAIVRQTHESRDPRRRN
eukprot:jgi/Undpi1/10036/HiC_scaffold_28.g12490.m1